VQEESLTNELGKELREALRQDAKALAIWQKDATNAVSSCQPVAFAAPDFNPDPNGLKSELASNLEFAAICDQNAVPASISAVAQAMKSITDCRPKLTNYLNDWNGVSTAAKNGGFRLTTLQSQYQKLFEGYKKLAFEQSREELGQALTNYANACIGDFTSEDPPDSDALIGKLKVIEKLPPITGFCASLIANLRKAGQDWRTANKLLAENKYEELVKSANAWNLLEKKQAGFARLLGQTTNEFQYYLKLKRLAEAMNYTEANKQWALLPAALREKPNFKALYERIRPDIAFRPPTNSPPVTNRAPPPAPVDQSAHNPGAMTPEDAVKLVKEFAFETRPDEQPAYKQFLEYKPTSRDDAVQYAKLLSDLMDDKRWVKSKFLRVAAFLAEAAKKQTINGLKVSEKEALRITKDLQKKVELIVHPIDSGP